MIIKAKSYAKKFANFINSNKAYLSIVYILMEIISIARIAIYLYISKVYGKDIITDDKITICIELCLSFFWFFNFMSRYISKMRGTYSENSRKNTFAWIIFFLQYISIIFWAREIVVDCSTRKYGRSSSILHIIYGFVSEFYPCIYIIVLYLIIICFILECLLRCFTCRCSNPWNSSETTQFVQRNIPIVLYDQNKHPQNNCGICLSD